MSLPLKIKKRPIQNIENTEPVRPNPLKQIPSRENKHPAPKKEWEEFAGDSPGSIDINKHLKMLTDVDVESPGEPMLTVSIRIGQKTFHQALDGVLALRWDNIKKRFEKDEVIKHLGMNAFYSATFLTAAAQASTDRERMETFYTVWWSEQTRVAEKAIIDERLAAMDAPVEGTKRKAGGRGRGGVGAIYTTDIEAWILTQESLKGQYLSFKKKIADAKADESLMKGLYQTMQNNGTYLQTLSKMFMTEDMGHR